MNAGRSRWCPMGARCDRDLDDRWVPGGWGTCRAMGARVVGTRVTMSAPGDGGTRWVMWPMDADAIETRATGECAGGLGTWVGRRGDRNMGGLMNAEVSGTRVGR